MRAGLVASLERPAGGAPCMRDTPRSEDYDAAANGRRCLVNSSVLRHRLMAILCADASGYSRLMAQDELATVAELDAARLVFRERIAEHGGRIRVQDNLPHGARFTIELPSAKESEQA